MTLVGGMAFFVGKVRSTVSRPTRCPACSAAVARDGKTCASCGNTL
jgi:rRNA maturation endonuclease Nob1